MAIIEAVISSIAEQEMSPVDVIQAILLVVSAILVIWQLHQTVKLARAANAQSLVEHAGSFNALLIGNEELAAIWYRGGKHPRREEMVDRYRYREMLVQWLIFHENIYHQRQKRLLDPSIYRSWEFDLRYTVKNHDLSVLDGEMPSDADGAEIDRRIKEFFPGDFGRHLISLRSQPTSPRRTRRWAMFARCGAGPGS